MPDRANVFTAGTTPVELQDASETVKGIVELATTTEATTGTDTTRAVTPAGVKAVVDALSIPDSPDDIGAAPAIQAINAQTGAYTLIAADAGKLVTLTLTAAADLTVPASTFTAGQRVDVAVLGEGMVTLVGSGITLNPEAGLSLVSRAQYSAFTIYFLTATTAFVTGSMAAA